MHRNVHTKKVTCNSMEVDTKYTDVNFLYNIAEKYSKKIVMEEFRNNYGVILPRK